MQQVAKDVELDHEFTDEKSESAILRNRRLGVDDKISEIIAEANEDDASEEEKKAGSAKAEKEEEFIEVIVDNAGDVIHDDDNIVIGHDDNAELSVMMNNLQRSLTTPTESSGSSSHRQDSAINKIIK